VTARGVPDLLTGWELEPVVAVALAATAIAYVAAARRARRWPARRTASFLAGLAVIAIALESGLHRYDDELLTVHMVEHLLILLVAPPLVLLGDPVGLALRTLPRAARRELAGALRSRPARTLLRPYVALAVFAAVLVGSHAPALYDAALRSAPLHAAEHAAYFWASLLFWTVVLGAPPAPSYSPLVRLLLLLGSMPAMALIGVGLMSADSVVYPTYSAGTAAWGMSALEDQHAAAALMWIGGSFALIGLTLAVAAWALLRDEARAVARESYAVRRESTRGAAP
jgi:cytochrome c oxidase assembly factor CtaG